MKWMVPNSLDRVGVRIRVHQFPVLKVMKFNSGMESWSALPASSKNIGKT